MFRDPVYLAWLLPALALAALAYARGASRRRRTSAALGSAGTLARLIPPETAARRAWKAGLQAAGLGLLFVALAGPQWGVELVATESKTHQVLIAVDTSLSMTAEDVKPNRLQKAKQELSLLLDSLRGNRVGVIAFAGEPALVCPMTTDVDAAKQILAGLEAGMIPVPGTGIGKAIRLASQTLSRYAGTKTLILLTDGEDHHTDPVGAAEEAASYGIRVFTIGIGSPEGEPIPLKDEAGALTGYKKDKQGQTVISHLGEKDLSSVAARAGGSYYRASPGENEAVEIIEQVLRTETASGTASSVNQYRNHYLLPLALAFLLLLAEFLLSERGGLPASGAPQREASPPRAGRALAALALLALAPQAGRAATAEGSLRRGNRLYRKEQYEPALEQYSVAGAKDPADPRPVFNAGDALYRLEQFDRAEETFRALAGSQQSPALRAGAYYNLGNIRLQSGDARGAIEDYRKSLALAPGDADASHNLAVALRQQKNPPSPQKKNGGQGQSKDKPQDQKEKQSGSDKGQSPPPPQTKTRPQDQMSREDAQRILRAVGDKEKSLRQQLQKKSPAKPPETEEDW